MSPPLLKGMTGALGLQVQAFGLMGAYLILDRPKISVSPEEVQRLIDPAVLKDMNTSKLKIDDTTWVSQRRLDISDLDRFVINRLQPCYPLFELADGDAAPEPDYPLLYQTNGWPKDAPPAGYVRQAPTFRWNDLLTSHINMWRLQLDRTKGLETTVQWTCNKLVRAALWIVKTEGFLPALDYLFSLMDHGFVIESDAAVLAFCWLFSARRQVADDSELPAYMLHDATLSMAAWSTADLKLNLRPPLRELTDDIDLAIRKVEERERLARAAQDCDAWLLAYARLGLAARATYQTMKVLGLAGQFGYKIYATRFEEVQCDVVPFFSVFRKDGATDHPGDALRPVWGIATSFAQIAKQEGEAWLQHMLQERIVLPDALISAFLKAPFNLSFTDAPEWQRPSPRLSRVLSQLVYREIPMERHRAVDGDPKTTAMVAGAFREARHPHLEDLADRASAIWPLFHREATAGPPPHDSDGEILLNFLLYLSVQMPTEREEAKAWLDRQHLEWSEADLERSYEEPLERGMRADHEARLRRADRYVTDYPYNGAVRTHLAIRQYEGDSLVKARGTVEEALMLDPGREYIWSAASLICNAAGQDDDDRLSSAMAKYLELRATDGHGRS